MDQPTADPMTDPAALLAEAEAGLAAINDALRRLDDGSYGRCGRCGADIAEDTLAADPLASSCDRCEGR